MEIEFKRNKGGKRNSQGFKRGKNGKRKNKDLNSNPNLTSGMSLQLLDQAKLWMDTYKDDIAELEEEKQREKKEEEEKRLLGEGKGSQYITKPSGRPPKYKESDCLVCIMCMSQGMGKIETACELGILPVTFYDWVDKHPAFSYAVKIGEILSERWWRDMGRLNLLNDRFNNVLWMMNMSNRFKWTRKMDVSGSVEKKKTLRFENSEERKVVIEAIDKRSPEHNAEVLRILIDAGILSAESKRIPETTVQ